MTISLTDIFPALELSRPMKRSLPHLLWSFGILLIVTGTVLGPGGFIPGEQPTPEMLAKLKTQLIFSNVGFVLMVIGVIWLVTRWAGRRFSQATAV